MAENLVEIRDLVKEFPVRGGLLQRQIGASQIKGQHRDGLVAEGLD